ncbi:MAG: MFS transporter, partial [Rhodococcus sp. (in: high G+C Gram-positive bacteria)]
PAVQADALLAAAGSAFDSGVAITSAIGAALMVVTALVAWRMLRPQQVGNVQDRLPSHEP